MSDKIFDSTIAGLNAVMNFRLLNQNVIASNIANADTPGYHAKKVEFESALRDALGVSDKLQLETSDPEHFVSQNYPAHLDPFIYDNPEGKPNLDGNTVDRAQEMVAMAENEANYNAATEMVRRKIALLKYAISEGGSR
jgi:flagellar basal-body rod protein FlgB